MQHVAVSKRLTALLLVLGPVTTLAISPFSNYDPINLIKITFVSSVAFALLALILSTWKSYYPRLPKGIWITVATFVLWMLVVIIASGAPINQQIWGVFGRNNGFLSYFSLAVVLIGVALIQEKRFYWKLVEALVLTAVPVTIYALIQVAGRDPISWSLMAPFATLGNINFSSAFFGLASICSTILALAPKQRLWLRFLLLAMVLVDLGIILETGSIQGIMIFFAGLGIAGYFIVRGHEKLQMLQIPYAMLGICTFLLTSMALKDVGPLARFIFGETILFRFDYWYAGWIMTLTNPLFGVGLDSYGDWYREARGELATLRTTPDRITNTAHNIYLDISASGGFPLIVAYLILLGYALRASIRFIKRNKSFDPYFVALFSSWVAYLVQAAISINQIGVGIWGWLFTGGLIGYEVATRESKEASPSGKLRGANFQLPALVALMGIAGFAIGFVLAFIPFNADARFKNALQLGDLYQLESRAKALGATSFHMELTLDAALKANNEPLAAKITDDLLRRYPRVFMGWRVKQILVSTSDQGREEAYARLRELDPFNPDIRRTE
jgi:O-antigen ligase